MSYSDQVSREVSPVKRGKKRGRPDTTVPSRVLTKIGTDSRLLKCTVTFNIRM